MSHYTVIKKTIITDQSILIKTLNKLGWEFKENHPIEGHQGRRCVSVAMKIGKKYCIGFNRVSGEQGYTIIADWPAIKISEKHILEKLYQTYNTEKVICEAQARGYSVVQQAQVKNSVRIVLRKVAQK
jgi:hypothetical protein